MTKQNSPLNAQEKQLIQRLRQHPELMERFESILEISASAVRETTLAHAQRAARQLEEEIGSPFAFCRPWEPSTSLRRPTGR